MKNTGKPSEQAFEEHWTALGKLAFFHRFVDASEIKGRTGKIGHARPAPSDYLVTHTNKTFYAEVKSTENETRFPFALLRVVQSAAAKQVLAAGGEYWIFAHSLHLNQWFAFPYSVVNVAKSHGQASIPWKELEQWKVNLGS